MEQQTLQELWALPRNMEPLPYDFHGKKLYSSDKLKLKFFEAVLATEWGKYHAQNLKRLVQDGYIVPALMTKNLIGFLAKKFLSKDWSKNVQGLYSSDLDKVLVFIDNNSTWMGLSSNKTLVKTTLHETMHLSASKNKPGFFKVMKTTFEKYYGSYYEDIFSCDSINTDQILKVMYKLEGIWSPSLHKQLIDAIVKAVKPTTDLSDEEYEHILQDVFTATRVLPTNPNLIMRFYPRYYHLFGPLNKAYLETFKERNSYTSPVQELWALSEVAAVMVELLPVDRRVSKLLSNIK
jgi:hypothetical protein